MHQRAALKAPVQHNTLQIPPFIALSSDLLIHQVPAPRADSLFRGM